jgi:hypothetical protein
MVRAERIPLFSYKMAKLYNVISQWNQKTWPKYFKGIFYRLLIIPIYIFS